MKKIPRARRLEYQSSEESSDEDSSGDSDFDDGFGDQGPDNKYEKISIADATIEGKRPTKSKYYVLFPVLEKLGLDNKKRIWVVGFDAKAGKIERWHGHFGGKIQYRPKEVETNTSGRNLYQQCMLEARNQHRKKIREGFVEFGSYSTPLLSVMRGLDYEKFKRIPKGKKYIDTKIDGSRMYVTFIEGEIAGMSRGNKPYATCTVGHILIEAEKILSYLPTGSILDGELCHLGETFQKTSGMCRTIIKRPEMADGIEYFIFDVYHPSNPPYEKRHNMLRKAIKMYRQERFGDAFSEEDFPEDDDRKSMRPAIPSSVKSSYFCGGRHEKLIDPRSSKRMIKDHQKSKFNDRKGSKYKLSDFQYVIESSYTKIFMPECHIVDTSEEIDNVYKSFLSRGYEGAMLKFLANGAKPDTAAYKKSQYLTGKGSRILKLKPFQTDEGVVVDVYEAKGNEEGCAMFTVEYNGHRFGVRMAGSFERRKEWFKNPDSVIGKPVTFKYKELTDDGVPREPTGVDIRDYEPGYDPISDNKKQKKGRRIRINVWDD